MIPNTLICPVYYWSVLITATTAASSRKQLRIQNPAWLNMDGDSEHVTGWGQLFLWPNMQLKYLRRTIQGHAAALSSGPVCSTASWAFPSEHVESPKHSQPPWMDSVFIGASKSEAYVSSWGSLFLRLVTSKSAWAIHLLCICSAPASLSLHDCLCQSVSTRLLESSF